MDNQKTIIALIAIAVVVGLFWFSGIRDVVPTNVRVVLPEKLTFEEGEGQLTAIAEHDELGSYLTDGSGRALYITTKEECILGCLSIWPPYLASEVIPEGDSRLGTVENEAAEGLQYMWDGKLLYYYINDENVGDVNGHEVGDVWFLVRE